MAATYNPGLVTDRDKIRFRLGDVNIDKALVPDETIMALLAVSGATVLSVAGDLAASIAAQYAQKVDTDLDNQGLKYSQLAKQFTDLAARLRAEDRVARLEVVTGGNNEDLIAMGGGILASGTSTSERRAARCDPENLDNYHPWLEE